MEVSEQLHAPATLIPGKGVSTHWIEGWIGLRAGLDAWQRQKFPSLLLLGIEPQSSSPYP
jgi:hypothetical protein